MARTVSMCPDPEILSVFLDNELPSPWKERLEAHLVSCEPCRAHLAALQGISRVMHEEAASSDLVAKAAYARIRERIEQAPASSAREKGARGMTISLPDFSRFARPVSIPFPVVAAAAAVFALMALLVMRPFSRSESSLPRIAAQEETIPTMDIPAILRYLEEREGSDGVMVIQLPESGSFVPMGEPTLIKAADYRGGSRR